MLAGLGSYYCPQCGYDLRGQTVDRCPECGFQYDRAAIESMTRQAFHGCIGPYLNAVPLLVWSPVLMLLRLSSLSRPFMLCSMFLILPLAMFVPQTLANWLQARIMGEAEDRPGRRREGYWAWPWNAEDLVVAGPYLMVVFVNAAFIGAFWRWPAIVFSGAMLAIGFWRTWAAASYQHELECTHQDLIMAPHRVRSLRRARSVCWALIGIDAVLWLVGTAV